MAGKHKAQEHINSHIAQHTSNSQQKRSLSPHESQLEVLTKKAREDPEVFAQEHLDFVNSVKLAISTSGIMQQPNVEAAAPERELDYYIGKHAGYNRLSIISNAWHDVHPDAVHFLFGYDTWKETKV